MKSLLRIPIKSVSGVNVKLMNFGNSWQRQVQTLVIVLEQKLPGKHDILHYFSLGLAKVVKSEMLISYEFVRSSCNVSAMSGYCFVILSIQSVSAFFSHESLVGTRSVSEVHAKPKNFNPGSPKQLLLFGSTWWLSWIVLPQFGLNISLKKRNEIA